MAHDILVESIRNTTSLASAFVVDLLFNAFGGWFGEASFSGSEGTFVLDDTLSDHSDLAAFLSETVWFNVLQLATFERNFVTSLRTSPFAVHLASIATDSEDSAAFGSLAFGSPARFLGDWNNIAFVFDNS